MPDRASRKFFTLGVLSPNGGAAYASVSQKILSATVCRYMILWASALLAPMACQEQNHLCLARLYFLFWNLFCIFPLSQTKPEGTFVAAYVCARWRCGLIGGLATMEVLMDSRGRTFTQNATAEFQRAYLVYRAAFNSLAELAIQNNLARYLVVRLLLRKLQLSCGTCRGWRSCKWS